MLIKQFLEWFTQASAAERVEAADALCEAYLAGYMAVEDPRDTEAALALILDDPSPAVRCVLADAFGSSERAPRHLIISLCYDQHEISVPVLARSPLLTDADLIDCLSVGDALTQMAVATRAGLSRSVCATLCEVGCVEAAMMLAKNDLCDIPAFSFARLADRFGDDARLRDVLLNRADLPLVIRHALVIKVSEHLTEMVCRGQWMTRTRVERLLEEARQAATVLLLGAAAADEVGELVEHMRAKGELTPALLLRALLSRDFSLFEAAMTSLSGLPARRVHALLHGRSMTGFNALYRRAKMPASLEKAFRIAVEGVLTLGSAVAFGEEPRLSTPLIQSVLLACSVDADDSRIMGLLRRLEAESMREDARHQTSRMLSAAPILQLDLGNRIMPVLAGGQSENTAEGLIDFAAIERELVSFAADIQFDEGRERESALEVHAGDVHMALEPAVVDPLEFGDLPAQAKTDAETIGAAHDGLDEQALIDLADAAAQEPLKIAA